MKSMSNKSGSCESNDGIEDRLSGLPDEVIVHILSLMPTLDAVRTMLLRRFGDLWTVLPSLILDFDQYFYRMLWINDEPPSHHELFSSFARFVQNVLMLYRRSAIDTFYLSIDDPNELIKEARIIEYVQTWLSFATDKQVKHLYFHCDACRSFIFPPPWVFTSQSLVTLTLSYCKLTYFEYCFPPHMGTLRKLSLICVCGKTDDFNKLISGCPSLQEIFIDNAYSPSVATLLTLNINAPSVSKLHLRRFDSLCILNCPGLQTLDIAVCKSTSPFQLSVIDVKCLQEVKVENLPQRCNSGLINAFFRLFQNTEVFTLSREAFERISSMEKIEFPQISWKRIVLHLQWNRERCLEVIYLFIKSSINLEELIICAGESSDNCELCCPELSTCVIPLLKTVTIHGNHGYENWCKGQLQVIEFLLRNVVVLDKLIITLGKSKLTTVEELDLIKQVSSFSRASANVTVIFA